MEHGVALRFAVFVAVQPEAAAFHRGRFALGLHELSHIEFVQICAIHPHGFPAAALNGKAHLFV